MIIRLYEELPIDLLQEFYREIQKNIEKGILSDRMRDELCLIKKAAEKKGLYILDEYRSTR
ncbi:hypothetical protein [Fictibacillus gelatini]|uniref:hypothetical protein n=1 Tax=Fictibacillus gelatini TaxID=225985 RepID=UPI0004013006|nr:hypothetical protein [Fictibacillus gelatini]